MSETLSASIPTALERRITAVLQALCDRELKIATAESCTGGLLASVLTDVEGLGHAFERSFVTYTDEAKSDCLDVPADLIRREGAVSQAVAIAMAKGCLTRSMADLALSATGFAGPAGEEDEEGLVYLALAGRDGTVSCTEHHFGAVGRGAVRIAALTSAMDLIEAWLKDQV